MNVLITFNACYADEFDVTGFRIRKKDDWEEHIQGIKNNCTWPQEMYFGTNEALMFESFEDYDRAFTVKEITKAEKKTIEKLLGKWHGDFIEIEL